MSLDLWMELARRITASERDAETEAARLWERFDAVEAARYRGRAEGLDIARDHQLTLAQESRDGTITAVQDALDGACHSVYLNGRWFWLTRQMSTEDREAFADACDRYGQHLEPDDPGLVPRWWRDDYTGPQPDWKAVLGTQPAAAPGVPNSSTEETHA
jgi:hypothetical protein